MVRVFVILVALLTAAPASAGPAPKIRLDPDTNKVVLPNLELHATWVAPAKKDWVVNLLVSNPSEDSVILFFREMTCRRGSKPGELKHARFGIGERTVDLHPSETKRLQLVCIPPRGTTGDFHLHIKRLWSNPSRDGRTPAEVLVEDITWVAREADVMRRR